MFVWMPDIVEGLEFDLILYVSFLYSSGDFSWDAVRLYRNILIILGIGFKVCWVGLKQHLGVSILELIILYYMTRLCGIHYQKIIRFSKSG